MSRLECSGRLDLRAPIVLLQCLQVGPSVVAGRGLLLRRRAEPHRCGRHVVRQDDLVRVRARVRVVRVRVRVRTRDRVSG